MRRPILSILFTLSLLPLAAAAAAATGELSLVGLQTSGDFGSGSDSERRSTLVRFLTGDRTQFRVDLELAQVKTIDGLVSTPVGPVPTQGRGPQGPRDGSGSGSGSGSSSGETSETPAVDDGTSGLGDLRLGVSHRLIGGGAKVFRLDAALAFKAPTADEADGLGTGEWDYRLGFDGQYRFWSSTVFGGLGWNVLGDPKWIELADVVDAYVGIESEPLRDRVILSAWFEGNEEVVEGTGARTALGLGARGTGKLRLRAQVTAGLSGSAEDFSALVGFSFGVSAPMIGSRTIR